MRRTNRFETWVVYRMTLRGVASPVNAVCEQGEWDAMEAARPGHHVLVRAGITSEGEAERLARGTSGDPIPRSQRSATGVPGQARDVPVGTSAEGISTPR
ncbi:MAG: hypothetical protein JWO38_6966 [Gemmataceae bacterium]|nr:hypothetical protein [Gemmataceae bacterium]